jgi:hypothetical protein
MSLSHGSLGGLTRVHMDGVPLDLAARLLPLASRLNPGLLTHIHLHSRSLVTGTRQHTDRAPEAARGQMSKTAMLGLIDSLTRTVERLTWEPDPTLWSSYMDHSNYTSDAQLRKQQLTAEWLERLQQTSSVRTVWDIGANTGTYSQLAASRTQAYVLALDLDHAAVEMHDRQCVARQERRIQPILQDLRNPSGAAGWNGTERRSLIDRGPADVALALAVVHHLAIGHNVPLGDIAAFFAGACRSLIVEFVPKDDSQVERMLALREDVFASYSQQGFEDAFARRFTIERSAPIDGTRRTLYLMTRRS